MKSLKYFTLIYILVLLVGLPTAAFSQPKLDHTIVDAVQKSDVPSLAIWMANGGDVNWPGNNDNTLLMLASKVGDLETLAYLLSQEPDINAQNKAGSTALMMAAKYGHADAVDMLLEEGADPLIRNEYGIMASRFALAFDHDDIFYHLQEAEILSRSVSSKSNG